MIRYLVCVGLLLATPALARGLEGAQGLRPVSGRLVVDSVRHRGRQALRVIDRPGPGRCCLVPLGGADFHNGTIDAWVAGRPGDGASAGARGFVGLAFRVQVDGRYEAFYIRPTNGRADDQLRRNHATQYISEPAFP